MVCRFKRVELGAVLANGAQCFIVSPDWWSVSSIYV